MVMENPTGITADYLMRMQRKYGNKRIKIYANIRKNQSRLSDYKQSVRLRACGNVLYILTVGKSIDNPKYRKRRYKRWEN